MKIKIKLHKDDDSMVELWSGKYLWAVVHRDLFSGDVYCSLDVYSEVEIELVILTEDSE